MPQPRRHSLTHRKKHHRKRSLFEIELVVPESPTAQGSPAEEQ
jgi:hypothetical protein